MIRLLEYYSLNELGRREQNEDSIWPRQASNDSRLFMVCDGVGGSAYGEVASALACEAFAAYFQNELNAGAHPDKEFILGARNYAMNLFGQHIEQNGKLAQMSTTLTLAYLSDDSVVVAWCGDSRIYHIRDGRILFQSEDHSLVNELVKRGEISKDEASNHPQKNIILRALQFKDPFSDIDVRTLSNIQTGDFILLCSDGLTEKIDEKAISEIFRKDAGDNLVELIQAYCRGNTRDNYSMYLLRMGSDHKAAPPARRKKNKLALLFIGLAITLIAGTLVYYALTPNVNPKADAVPLVNAQHSNQQHRRDTIRTQPIDTTRRLVQRPSTTDIRQARLPSDDSVSKIHHTANGTQPPHSSTLSTKTNQGPVQLKSQQRPQDTIKNNVLKPDDPIEKSKRDNNPQREDKKGTKSDEKNDPINYSGQSQNPVPVNTRNKKQQH